MRGCRHTGTPRLVMPRQCQMQMQLALVLRAFMLLYACCARASPCHTQGEGGRSAHTHLPFWGSGCGSRGLNQPLSLPQFLNHLNTAMPEISIVELSSFSFMHSASQVLVWAPGFASCSVRAIFRPGSLAWGTLGCAGAGAGASPAPPPIRYISPLSTMSPGPGICAPM